MHSTATLFRSNIRPPTSTALKLRVLRSVTPYQYFEYDFSAPRAGAGATANVAGTH